MRHPLKINSSLYIYLNCWGALTLAMLGLGGCAQQPFNEGAWPAPRPLGEASEVYRPPRLPEAPAGIAHQLPPRPTGALTLRQALALAVAHNPALHAFGWEVRAAEARVLQAGLRPNPELEAEFENFAGDKSFSGTQSLETTISLAQTFPLGGDMARRRELAELESQMTGWDYEAARLEVLTEVTRRYLGLLGAQRRVTLAQEALTLAAQVRETTDRRISAGDAPPIDAARASVPVATARVDLRRAERQQQAARRKLALMWSSQEPTFDEVQGGLERLQAPPPAHQLVALVNQNPQVARWAVEISARLAEAEQAQAGAVPDVTARAGVKYDRAEDAGALLVGISLPLPVFDRRQGAELAARLGATAAAERRREAERRVEAALSDAYARMAAGFDEAVAIRDLVLPPATEAFELTQQAFEEGDLALIDVLDAERTLVELHSTYFDALMEYHLAVTEIEGLIGRPLEQFSATSESIPPTKTREHP
jgi:cobalt-zinc-cadmium efflux system outer membrane protein